MRVMVINSSPLYASNDLAFPPVGAIGEVVSDVDEKGEYDVLFSGFPCLTTPLDPTWITHKSMIVFLDGGDRSEKEAHETKQIAMF